MLARVLSAVFAATVAMPLWSGIAAAGPHEHDDVRRAVSRGEIRPLADILARVRGQLPGEIVGVEVEREKGRWVYELRVLDAQGRLFDVYVDAQDGAIQRIKGK